MCSRTKANSEVKQCCIGWTQKFQEDERLNKAIYSNLHHIDNLFYASYIWVTKKYIHFNPPAGTTITVTVG